MSALLVVDRGYCLVESRGELAAYYVLAMIEVREDAQYP